MADFLDRLPDDARQETIRRQRQPSWVAPMLATLTHKPFSRAGWIYERKLDGERCLVFRKGRRIRLLSRNRKPLNRTYPELKDAIARQKAEDFIADGEIVAFSKNRTSFSRLQQRMQVRRPTLRLQRKVRVYYYLFDLLHFDGWDITQLELRHRKAILEKALSFADPLRFTRHRNRQGEAYLKAACGKGWEGLIAKRADAAYVHRRSPDWLKFKCAAQQELVVGGYTDPEGARSGLGALLVGYYENGRLIYAGKVGTGFDHSTLHRLAGRLSRLKRRRCPFSREIAQKTGVHWVRPKLVAEIGFTEWTRDGKLRHPRYLGLRRDKKPREVVREGRR